MHGDNYNTSRLSQLYGYPMGHWCFAPSLTSMEAVFSVHRNSKVKAFDEDFQPMLGFEWTVLQYAKKSITISLKFENPQVVSQDLAGKDILKIKVLNPTKFFSDESFTSVKNETTIEVKLPKQMAQDQEEAVLAMQA